MKKMPRFDRTGPLGQGPLTGRGLGPCGVGRAWGGRPRFGLFWGQRSWGVPYQRMDSQSETQMLEDETKALEEELTAIKERLEEIKK